MSEARLDELRRTATPPAARDSTQVAGYYGRPVLKTPPWTWEVPLYLFIGGMAGASASLALGARVGGAEPGVVIAALWLGVAGAALSAILLVSDLGRPTRFLHMLRVFKWRSPMSVGAWLLTAFGAVAAAALAWETRNAYAAGESMALSVGLGWALLAAAAVLGALVATYTGVLLSITVVPAWRVHPGLLPVHFGVAALGSAAAALELLGFRLDALDWIGLLAALAETALWLWTESPKRRAADLALRRGRTGLFVRTAYASTGPLALTLRLAGWATGAAAAFLLGALLSRFAWIAAGRASARDPKAVLSG